MKIPPRKMHTESWWNVSYEGYTRFRRSLFIVESPVIGAPLKTPKEFENILKNDSVANFLRSGYTKESRKEGPMSTEHPGQSENSEVKENKIKESIVKEDELKESAEIRDPHIGFMQEEIKKRPLNRRKMVRRMTYVAVMAAVFGAVACLFFLLLEPIFNRMLYPEEAVTGVTYPEETIAEEVTPEEMLVNEEEKAATEEQERIRAEVERYLSDKEKGAEAAERMYTSLRQVAAEARYFLVDVSEISSDTDWFNDPHETRGTASGMIIAKTDSEIQVLVYAPNIDSAQKIQVTLFDGSSVEAEIRARDRASGLVVLSAGISDVDRAVREQLTAATLGSSSPTYITGLMVIAVGRPIGTSGSISYGSASSATGDLAIQDSGLKQITTDIYGSRQASGFLLNPMGQVVGILDPRHGRSDLPNLLCAIGISECKPLIEKLSAGGKKAYLGVQCTDVPAEIRKRMSIPDGVYVNGVADVSPAMNAGLQKGDVITAMAGEDIYYSSGVSRILLEAEAGEELVITLMRPSGEGYTQMELTAALE